MAILMRRGSIVDFDPSKTLPGEWAIPYDNNDVVYICVSQGHVVEIASASITKNYMEGAEAWAIGTKNGIPVTTTDIQYENNSKYYADNAGVSESNALASALDSEAWAVGERAGVPVTSGDDTYENNSKYYAGESGTYWGYIDNAVNLVTPQIDINWTTGQLEVSGSAWFFKINQTTGFLEWSITAI